MIVEEKKRNRPILPLLTMEKLFLKKDLTFVFHLATISFRFKFEENDEY